MFPIQNFLRNKLHSSQYFGWLLISISLGLCTSISQIVIQREILNFGKGNELTISASFFFWLAGLGIGALTLSHFFSKHNLKTLLLILCYIFPITSITFCSFVRIFNILFPLEVHGMVPGISSLLLCCIIGLFIPGILWGAMFPLIVSASSASIKGGDLYLLEALGSALGGTFFTFALAGKVPHFPVLAGSGLIIALSATFLITTNLRYSWKKSSLWIVVLILSSVILFVSPSIEKITNTLRWKSISGNVNLLKTVDTRYQRIDIAYDPPQYSIFSDGSFDFSFPDPYDISTLAQIVFLEHPRPQKILIAGGNPIDPIQKAVENGIERIDYVQIDPKIMELISFYVPKSIKKIFCGSCAGRFIPQDGKRFIINTPAKTYDIVWFNLPDPNTLLINRYYTVETYEQIRRILKPDGIFVTQFSLDYSAPQKVAKKYSASIMKSIEKIFPKTIIALTSQIIVFAGSRKSALTENPFELAGRAKTRKVTQAFHDSQIFENFFNQNRNKWLREIFKNEKALFNTDSHPITYRLELQYFTQLIGSNISKGKIGFFEKFLEKSWQVPWWAILLPSLLLIIPFLFAKTRKNSPTASSIYAIITTGASGMVLEIVLLLSYQTFSGIMYEGIGLLYAGFMVGLTAGTLSGKKSGKKNVILSELLVILNILITGIFLPFCKHFPSLITLFVLSSGFATGFAFPVFYNFFLYIKGDLDSKAHTSASGIIDGADHIGASLGAILPGIILVPAIGLINTIWVMGVYKISSFTAILLTRRK